MPYVDNEALYHLLGSSTYLPAPFAQEPDDFQGLFIPGERAGTKAATMLTRTSTRSRYHTHGAGAEDVESRKRQRELRLRGVEKRKPAMKPETVPLPSSSQKADRSMPTLENVIAAFPGRKPSKRDIQKHFGITDYQAYKLYRQLDK